MAAWWDEQPSSKPQRQSSSSSTESSAALRTPPPTTPIKSKLYSSNDRPALGEKESLDWGYIITVLALILIIVTLSNILKSLIAKLARRDAEDTQDDHELEGSPRKGVRPSVQTSTSSTLQKRGLDTLFPTNPSLPMTDSLGRNPDTEARKDVMSVDKNIQAYLAQNGGNGGRRLGVSETYARRKRREQEGYLVGF